MFGMGRKGNSTRIDTVIGEHTVLEGDVHFSGGLHIDGTVKGDVIAEPGSSAVLTVSECGRIEGDVRVPQLVLNGSVRGDVHAGERVELACRAQVTGNLYYRLIEMAAGAQVNGSLVHEGASEAEDGPAHEEPVLPAGLSRVSNT